MYALGHVARCDCKRGRGLDNDIPVALWCPLCQEACHTAASGGQHPHSQQQAPPPSHWQADLDAAPAQSPHPLRQGTRNSGWR